VSVLLLAGMLLARQVRALVPHLSVYRAPAALALAVLLLGYVGYRLIQRHRFLSRIRTARISVQELYGLMQAHPPPVVVDVRSDSARALDPRWIPGAVHLALHDIATHVEELPRDRDVILYCNCPNEASAAMAARTLTTRGFKRVRPLLGGLEAWVAAGYPVDTQLVTELRATSVANA
jgi:rhodanese-related sulfurtransferase